MNNYINIVELQGVIGSIRENEFSGKYVYDISVCTESTYQSSGNWIIDSIWHQVKHWSDTKLNLEKGKWVHIKGRLRINKYTDGSGNERTFQYVYATELNVLKDDSSRSN